ncbi:hypothetical protein [Deinococcus terrestris]|uniref:hypothetical protein n=1 Tax=Deinococcus terrestris TaxID=2651870 RepID=UPI0018836CD0|nr:hypothetical protein [Deinococcus terrestris]
MDAPTSLAPAASPRRLPTLTGLAESDVGRLHDLSPDVVLGWARELTHQAEEEEWG